MAICRSYLRLVSSDTSPPPRMTHEEEYGSPVPAGDLLLMAALPILFWAGLLVAVCIWPGV